MPANVFTAPPEINQYGWVYYDKCRCNGTLKYKYRNAAYPGLELEWWVRAHQFQIRNRNSTKVPPTKLGKLEETLKNLTV